MDFNYTQTDFSVGRWEIFSHSLLSWESLKSESFLGLQNIGRVLIDVGHCMSPWGTRLLVGLIKPTGPYTKYGSVQ